MRVTVFNGSPKGKRSSTNVMVEEFLKDIKGSFDELENIMLARKKIKNCTGCFTCWTRTPGKCIIEDDMEELLSKFISSDYVVFASPLYFDNVTGIMKNFFDRLIPLMDPRIDEDSKGESVHRKRFHKYPKIIAISNCGFAEQSHFQVISLLYKRMARNMHTEVVAEIYSGEGPLLTNNSESLRSHLESYRELLRMAGAEFVENSEISEDTMIELNRPIIPRDMYIADANRSWQQ